MADIPRGRYIGKPADGIPTTEAEHYMRCPACGGMIDCRDLAQASSGRIDGMVALAMAVGVAQEMRPVDISTLVG